MNRVAFARLAPVLALAACSGEAPTSETGTRPSPAPEANAGTGVPASISDKAEAGRIAHDRHERFEEIGKAYKAINDQLKSASPDRARIADRAAVIERYAPQIASWFPAGTGPQDGVRTDALAAVWTEPERFRKAAAGMVSASSAFAAASRGDDLEAVRAAARQLGQACKTCHDRFREEEDD